MDLPESLSNQLAELSFQIVKSALWKVDNHPPNHCPRLYILFLKEFYSILRTLRRVAQS